VIAAYIIAW